MNPDQNTPQTNGFNPAAAAAPNLSPAPNPSVPETPAMPPADSSFPPDAPTIDPSLLAQAINDVPEEAAATTPAAPSAVSLDNLAESDASDSTSDTSNDLSAFTSAAPAAEFTDQSTASNPNTAEAQTIDEPQKQTPSVAFNDPAQMPDKPAAYQPSKPSPLDKLKKINPLILIGVGGALLILALILIIAFAV
ncbi:hypothetical protein IJH29_01690 [Candidatus Saccharibacteria bacterium]|nr:hypothetical protein [Candidatus Saccharibacteria bacterium]